MALAAQRLIHPAASSFAARHVDSRRAAPVAPPSRGAVPDGRGRSRGAPSRDAAIPQRSQPFFPHAAGSTRLPPPAATSADPPPSSTGSPRGRAALAPPPAVSPHRSAPPPVAVPMRGGEGRAAHAPSRSPAPHPEKGAWPGSRDAEPTWSPPRCRARAKGSLVIRAHVN